MRPARERERERERERDSGSVRVRGRTHMKLLQTQNADKTQLKPQKKAKKQFERHLYDALFLSEPHRSGVSTCWTRAFHARQLQGTAAPSSAAPSANSIKSAVRPRVAVSMALWLDVASKE